MEIGLMIVTLCATYFLNEIAEQIKYARRLETDSNIRRKMAVIDYHMEHNVWCDIVGDVA